MSKKFDISQFECGFYTMLFKYPNLDTDLFDRNICYKGNVIHVLAYNGRIAKITRDTEVLYEDKKAVAI